MYNNNPTTIRTTRVLVSDERLLLNLNRSNKFENGVISEAKKTPKINVIKKDDP
jgi:hypothetical protein